MRLYDLVLVVKSSLSDKERGELFDTVKGWLKPARNASQREAGGDVKITKEESWGQKPLAYKIKQEVSGFYHKMELEADPSTLRPFDMTQGRTERESNVRQAQGSGQGKIPTDFEKRLNSQESVLRHLLLRKK